MTNSDSTRPLRVRAWNGSLCPEAAIRGGTRIGSVAGNPEFRGSLTKKPPSQSGVQFRTRN